MDKAMRWRIVSLQAILVVILAAVSGFLFVEGTFVQNMVKEELTSQQIFFPGTDQVKAGGALDPAVFPAEIRAQAGLQVTNGDQARIYANDFIGKHLQGIDGGRTYAQIGAQVSGLQAQQAGLAKTDPQYVALQTQIATLNAQRDTVFKGEMLRGTLLNAYGWWTVGAYTIYGAFGALAAALGVLVAMVFELLFAVRKETETVRVKKLATA